MCREIEQAGWMEIRWPVVRKAGPRNKFRHAIELVTTRSRPSDFEELGVYWKVASWVAVAAGGLAVCGGLAVLGVAAAEPDQRELPAAGLSFHADIFPLLQKHCADCHGADQADGEFRVDTYRRLLQGGESAEAAVIPGNAAESPLVQYLTGKRSPRMPKQRKPLADDELARIRAWIEQGAREGKPVAPVAFSQDQIDFFEINIRPLFAQHCLECHGADKANGNLAFLSRDDLLRGGTLGPAIVPGKPAESRLISALRHTGKLQMPKSRPRLDEALIQQFERWIAMNAPWPATDVTEPPKIRTKFAIYESDRDHWAFQPVVRPELPAVAQHAWPRDDLDRFILARLEAAQLAPAPTASRQTLIRRLSFDLTGLPPTPEDLVTFGESSQRSLEAYVDKLLGSEEFGEHWARHWLDNVRYRPLPKKTERDDPYRQWVVQAFNEDMPYDRFLRMQIAGDLIPAEQPDQVHLDGLIAVRPWSLKNRHEQQIDLLGRTFLGLSLFCARCHDHKLEPISRDDYYAIQGIFESSQVVQVPFLKEKSQFDDYMAGLARVQDNETRMKKELKKFSPLAALVDLRARLASERQKLNDREQDQAKVQASIDKLLAEEQKRLAEIEKKMIDLDAAEARQYMQLRRENNEFAERWKDVYQLDAFVDQSDTNKIGDAAPPKQGVETKPGESPPTDPAVPRRFPTILAGFEQIPLGEQTTQSGRLELAAWLADADHPITARLITNRIWYYLMGEGLVRSLSNFGRSGDAPSHPDLLDYLSDELVRHHWSMKQLIRRIALSSTYQQSSSIDPPQVPTAVGTASVEAAEPGETINDERDERLRLFGVARRKRLEVESILRTLAWLEHDPQSSDRRRDPGFDMVNEMRLLFDGANSNLIVPRRTSSVSPLQALFLMNSDHVKASTERIAARLAGLPNDSQRIRQAFLLLYGREPSPEEIDQGEMFLREWDDAGDDEQREQPRQGTPPEDPARWQAYLQVMLLANEFLYVD